MKNTKEVHVVGTTFKNRQGCICYIMKNAANAYVSVRRDKRNKFDANAIKVIGHVKGGKHVELGFLPKALAKKIAPVMDSGKRPWVSEFRVVCGGKNRTYGVVIDIQY